MKSRISMFLFREHSSRSSARPAKLVRGMPRAPKANKIGPAASKSKTGRAAIRRNAILEKHAKQLHVRMSQDELERARRLASSLGMTLSDCVRVLLQLPAPTVQQGGASLIVVDRGTAVGIRRELRRWGHHYNQAVHALNAIAYYLRLDEMDSDDVLEELGKAGLKLETMNSGVESLRSEITEISAHPRAFM